MRPTVAITDVGTVTVDCPCHINYWLRDLQTLSKLYIMFYDNNNNNYVFKLCLFIKQNHDSLWQSAV